MASPLFFERLRHDLGLELFLVVAARQQALETEHQALRERVAELLA